MTDAPPDDSQDTEETLAADDVLWNEPEDEAEHFEFAAEPMAGEAAQATPGELEGRGPREPAAPPVEPAELASSTAWDRDWSAARIAHELQEIEDEIRERLEERDPKRKRKFSGTRRWWELEEDLIGFYGADRFDGATIARIRQLVARRNALFRRLRFLSATRPTWNS